VELIEPVSQHVVVAAWLAAEIDSSRFSSTLRAILARDGRDPRLLRSPDLTSTVENLYRLRLLGEFRGFGRPAGADQGWLAGRAVDDLCWWRVRLHRTDLGRIRFTDGGFWRDESEGTRLPEVHVRRLLADPERPEDDLPNLVRDQVRDGRRLPPMILIDAGPGSRLVVLEGHVRLVAYIMAGPSTPDPIDALLGRSPSVTSWPEY